MYMCIYYIHIHMYILGISRANVTSARAYFLPPFWPLSHSFFLSFHPLLTLSLSFSLHPSAALIAISTLLQFNYIHISFFFTLSLVGMSRGTFLFLSPLLLPYLSVWFIQCKTRLPVDLGAHTPDWTINARVSRSTQGLLFFFFFRDWIINFFLTNRWLFDVLSHGLFTHHLPSTIKFFFFNLSNWNAESVNVRIIIFFCHFFFVLLYCF